MKKIDLVALHSPQVASVPLLSWMAGLRTCGPQQAGQEKHRCPTTFHTRLGAASAEVGKGRT